MIYKENLRLCGTIKIGESILASFETKYICKFEATGENTLYMVFVRNFVRL
jgi:hypothetical protein